ncbi:MULTISPECIES: TolC family protein [Thiomicrorhabdus]|uniref:TolC family protein n=1 Tax=Thiomicrorhabdus heinhorstiae TaxID=2748010 RepID=A0ABS0C1I6_9GAMM|nr:MULTISPECIES: TolC family protein [Thiomicrorhabdus]MBF6058187.1 TolC family protein [Thiomicrorhabdus heinhorstiae]
MKQKYSLLKAGSLMLTALLPWSVYAQTYDFKMCVEDALHKNPEMDVSSSRIQQAQSALQQAEASRYPQVNLSVTATNSDNPLNVFGMKIQQRQAAFADFGVDMAAMTELNNGNFAYEPSGLNYPGAHTDFNTRIEMLIPIWNGGKIKSYEEQAAAMIEAAQQGDSAVQQYLTYNVYQAYEGVHAARSYIKVAEQAKKTADSFVKTTRNLVEQGVVVRSELLSAEVHQSTAEVALMKAQGQEQIALDSLRMLMNMDASAELDVADRMDLQLPKDSIDSLLALAMNGNPQLEAQRKEANSSHFAIDAARADKYPHFNVMLRQDWNSENPGFDSSSYTIAGVVSWKITDFGVTASAIDMANASAEQKKAAVRSAENKVRLDLLTSWRKMQIAQKQVQSNELAVKQAEEALELIMRRYENGVATMTEVLLAQTQLDKARADLVSANYDVNVYKAKLRLFTGTMDIKLL